MSELDVDLLDEFGPVDYLVVEFPPGRQAFTGELGDELLRLVDTETVRLLDLIVVSKAEDGSIDAVEIDETDERDEIRALERHVAEILAADDVQELTAAMEPGSVGGIIVWENRWAAPFASAARRSGGQLVASGRIPIQALLASLDADLEAAPDTAPEGS